MNQPRSSNLRSINNQSFLHKIYIFQFIIYEMAKCTNTTQYRTVYIFIFIAIKHRYINLQQSYRRIKKWAINLNITLRRTLLCPAFYVLKSCNYPLFIRRKYLSITHAQYFYGLACGHHSISHYCARVSLINRDSISIYNNMIYF